jgi:hypothetical protein
MATKPMARVSEVAREKFFFGTLHLNLPCYIMKCIYNYIKALLDASKEVGLEVNPEKTTRVQISGNNTNRSKRIHEEIKSRLNSGSVCYHSVQSFVISPAVQECKG